MYWSEVCKIAIDYVNARFSDLVNCILPGPALDPLEEMASHLPETPPSESVQRVRVSPPCYCVTHTAMTRASYDKRYRAEYADRVRYINVAFARADLARIEARAAGDGTRVAPLVRELTLAQLDGTAFVSKTMEGKVDQLRWLMSNIANNVNQMARHSNRLRVMVEEDELLVQLEKLEQLVIDYTLDRLKASRDHQIDDPQG